MGQGTDSENVKTGLAPVARVTAGSSSFKRMPLKLSTYIIDFSILHQIFLLALTIVVFLMEVVPLELQRRIVNDAVKHRHLIDIAILCAIYAGVSLTHGATKLGLNIYRAWIGQRATRDLRKRIELLQVTASEQRMIGGVETAMVVTEAEPIGQFVAQAISEPLLQFGILASVLAYIIHVDPIMTLIGVLIFVPQFIFVPLMQGAINRRTKGVISVVRRLSTHLTGYEANITEEHLAADKEIDRVFFLNMGIFKLKYTLNFLMNFCTHLQVIAALLYGGWLVQTSQLEIGGVVAFISGLSRITDPWGDLINYFRDISVTRVKYRMLSEMVNQIGENSARNENLTESR